MNDLTALIERLEQADADGQADALREAIDFAWRKGWIVVEQHWRAIRMLDAEAYESAALLFVPEGYGARIYCDTLYRGCAAATVAPYNRGVTDLTDDRVGRIGVDRRTPALALSIAAFRARAAVAGRA